MAQSATKNTTLMTMASVGQKVLSSLYFIILARYLGVEDMGKYFFALSFTTIFAVFADLGLTNVLVREAAKAKDRIGSYLGTVLSIKFLLGAVSVCLTILTIRLLQYPIETRFLVYIAAGTMLLDTTHLTLYGVLRALGDLRYEAASIVAFQLVTLVLGFVCIVFHLPLGAFLFTFTVASICNVMFVAFILYRRYHLSLRPRYDKTMAHNLVRIAVPFALAAIFARVYGYIDSILLSKLAGDVALGWYSVPSKIVNAFQFVPVALVAALYPRFSEYYASDKQRLARVFEQSLQYVLVIALPISVGIFVLAKPIILTLFTAAYTRSIAPLQILILSLTATFLSFPIGALLNAGNRQKVQTTIVGVVMLANIILNIFFIPRYGATGAALSALISALALALIGYAYTSRIAPVSHRLVLKILAQLGFAAGVMGIVVWWSERMAPMILAIFIGVCIYPLMLFFTRALTTQQLREAWVRLRQ